MDESKFTYNITNSGEKFLVKILIRNASTEEGKKILRRLRWKYRPNTIQFWTYLNHQQIAGLKKHYGEKIAILYGKLIHRNRFDEIPKEEI